MNGACAIRECVAKDLGLRVEHKEQIWINDIIEQEKKPIRLYYCAGLAALPSPDHDPALGGTWGRGPSQRGSLAEPDPYVGERVEAVDTAPAT